MRLPDIRALAVVLALFALPAVGRVWLRHSLETTPPIVPPPDLLSIFFDTSPVTVVFTFEGEQVMWLTTADDIRPNLTLWRHMHLAEWNTAPDPHRREGLDKMLARYRGLLMNPEVWDGMDVEDWDQVPQPMRTLAYRQMVAYWAGYYDVGARYELLPGVVADTANTLHLTRRVVGQSAAGPISLAAPKGAKGAIINARHLVAPAAAWCRLFDDTRHRHSRDAQRRRDRCVRGA